MSREQLISHFFAESLDQSTILPLMKQRHLPFSSMPRATVLLVLAAVLPPLAAATVVRDARRPPAAGPRVALGLPSHVCGTQGTYAPGSAYQAHLRLLVAKAAAKAAAGVNPHSCNCSLGGHADSGPAVAYASCSWRPDWSASDCGACVARAFREAQRLCPYHREAAARIDGGVCVVSFHDAERREQETRKIPSRSRIFWMEHARLLPDVVVVSLLQAAGLGCVVFLFIQERRARGRRPASNGNLPVTTGDQHQQINTMLLDAA